MKASVKKDRANGKTPALGNERASGSVIDALASFLKGRGVGAYEIFYGADEGLGVEVTMGAIDAFKVRSTSGVGLRIIKDNRQGFGFSSVLDNAVLREIAERTVTGLEESAEDKNLSFPDACVPAINAKELEESLFDAGLSSVSEGEKIRFAATLEEAAMAESPKIRRIRKASYNETVHYSRLVNSNGVDVQMAGTFFSSSVTAVAEDEGGSQMGWEMGMGHKMAELDPTAIGRGAALNALRMLGARTIKTAKCPAIIENTVMCELVESLASSFLADNVHKGKSMLIGRLGKRVASNGVSVYDDGLIKGGWASSVYDAEGAPRQRTPLIEKGVALSYLYDTYWAKRDGGKSTGNSARPGFKAMPSLSTSNVYLEKGDSPLSALLREAGTGIFITDVLGAHTINTVTGEFSLGAAGIWIENGELAFPVRGLAFSGDLLGLFSRVVKSGSDMRFLGSVGSPSALVSELELSGT